MILLMRVCTIAGEAAMEGSILPSQRHQGEAEVE